MSKTSLHATTIYAVRHNGEAMVGDGQVTLGEQVIMKQTRARSADYMKEKC